MSRGIALDQLLLARFTPTHCLEKFDAGHAPSGVGAMWHGIRRSPLRFVYRDYDDVSSPQGMSAAALPLDPVTPDNVACIKNPALGFAFGESAWRVITDPQYFYTMVVNSSESIDPTIMRTVSDYREHVKFLKDWGLLETANKVYIAGRYFA